MKDIDILLTPNQMRDAEQSAVNHGISFEKLMYNAGLKLSEHIFSIVQKKFLNKIMIICGCGNNGGDGFAAADFLISKGLLPIIVLIEDPKTELSINTFGKIKEKCNVIDMETALKSDLIESADIIVDCVFGTGFHGKLSNEIQNFFHRINLSKSYRIACDIPSGANAYNGMISDNTFNAHETVTFHKEKSGLCLSPAKDKCGKINISDIGIGSYYKNEMNYKIFKVNKKYIKSLLPYRSEDSHKGTFGKVMLVCGSEKYPGAAIISSKSALRSGVGIVKLCADKKNIAFMSLSMPECTFIPVEYDINGLISDSNIDIILKNLELSDSVIVGCGLGVSESAEFIVCEIIKKSKCPLIIDADGINCLAKHIDVLKQKQTEIILTPHPAELARLCGESLDIVRQDILGYAQRISQRYNVTVHAKNTQTFTVKNDKAYLTDFGCSALAKGGSGDMLAGLIGGFAAQGITDVNSCILADYIIGESAKNLCETLSPRGVLATDIISQFPKTFFEIEQTD